MNRSFMFGRIGLSEKRVGIGRGFENLPGEHLMKICFVKLFVMGLVLSVVSLSLASLSFAQTSKGTIVGTVLDTSGAAVANAEIKAEAKVEGETRTTTSGSFGEYRITAVLPGIYKITVKATGFADLVVDNVSVVASVETPVELRLQLGASTVSVLVEATGSQVQTDSAELSHNISSVEIQELPINSLNPISLVLTEPGVVRVSSRDSFTNGVDFAVDGLRPRGNNFLIDGFDNNDNGIAGQAVQPQNLEAISEVVIQTNSYSAQFGRGGASVTNVIYRSGTNNWHGAGYYRYSGSAFNALTPELVTAGNKKVPVVVENIPGFRIGGPVLKNKVFIFGSSQWDRLRGAELGAQFTIPTAAGIAALQSIGPNSNVQLLLASLNGAVAPSPTPGAAISIGSRTGCGAAGSNCVVEVGQYSRTPGQISNAYEYVIRGDYVASQNDTISARWLASHNSLTPDLFANPGALPGFDTQQGGPSRSLGLFWTHVINDHSVNELRVTSQTINFGFDLTAATAANPRASLPSVSIAGLTGLFFGGVTTGFPQDRKHSVYQYQDAFSITVGHHNLEFGADITHLGIVDGEPFNSNGTLTYNASNNSSGNFTGLANFVDDFGGNAGTASKQFGVSQVSYAQTQQAYYFQDEWKLRPNFTLNYGLRYEVQSVPFNALPFPAVNRNTVLTDPLTLRVEVNSDRDNFGPRLGFAYTPRFWRGLLGENKTVFRAGAGIFYDVFFSNILANNAASTPNVTGGTITSTAPTTGTGRGAPNFSTVIPGITPALSNFDAVSTVVSSIYNPKTIQWNANIERELPGSWLATVAYVGTRGEHLFLNQELNPGVNGVRLNPNRGGIFARTNNGDSIYHGLQLKAEHRFRRNLFFRAAYTYSKSLDNGSEVFVTSGGSTRNQDQFTFRGDRGPSAFDRRQRAVFTWVYDIPGVRGDSGLRHALNYATSGWEVSGTAAFETGAPETLFLGGFDTDGDLSGFNDRPSQGNPKVPINFTSTCQDPAGTCDTGFGFSNDGIHFTDFFSGFGPPDASGNFTATKNDFRYYIVSGQRGNIGRNTFNNPGREDWAMSVQREFKLPVAHLEQQAFLIRLEAFNPFNHPNLGGGENGVASVSGDLLSGTNFLNKSITRVGGRTVKFFVRYSF
jgi:outer membrane receptor protein involved in Fe transport